MKKIVVNPTWTAAVRLYMAVLEDPSAGEKAKNAARADLMSLAAWADRNRARVHRQAAPPPAAPFCEPGCLGQHAGPCRFQVDGGRIGIMRRK